MDNQPTTSAASTEGALPQRDCSARPTRKWWYADDQCGKAYEVDGFGCIDPLGRATGWWWCPVAGYSMCEGGGSIFDTEAEARAAVKAKLEAALASILAQLETLKQTQPNAKLRHPAQQPQQTPTMPQIPKPSPVPSEPRYLQRIVRRLRWEIWQCLKGTTLIVLLFIALDVRADLGWVRIICAAVVLNYLAAVLNAQPNRQAEGRGSCAPTNTFNQ